jgi:hypothetical protein
MAKFAGEQLSLIAEDFDDDRPIGDWDWEINNLVLLPKVREQHLTLLPKVREQERDDRNSDPHGDPHGDSLLPNFREQASIELLPKVREQLYPAREIREQLLAGQTVIGYSIVQIKNDRYYLTHAKSTKYYPMNGWWDIKNKKGINYLYTRWREGVTQKSRCLGRLDRLE